MNSETLEQAVQTVANLGSLGKRLGQAIRTQAHIDESLPTGVVEQRAPGRPTVRMNPQSLIEATRREFGAGRAVLVARRKLERQRRTAGRRERP